MLPYIILVVISAKLDTLLCHSTWVAHVEVSNPTAKSDILVFHLFKKTAFNDSLKKFRTQCIKINMLI